ncbi:hypothetical protein HIM_04172 [Hirsutella minnesotensis 3608]|uniref:N-acetyltransferase domain-containing protein n=1 Tax=Hirsutella minnesotensis 3608 TaxID=1043627 RepID=A0A0F7ZVD9_9HYPO|nr:hypothetical protein HIM_04172 [Hirsutella minnesotensis 3608]
MEYQCIRIDKSDPQILALALKYKQLRLAALQHSPDAFSSTLELESSFSDDVWVSRICDPSKETFVCCAGAPSCPLESEWVGQVTLLGPVSSGAYRLPADAGQPPVPEDGEEEKWQMLSLYTLPAHRGHGLGKLLCREAFGFLAAVPRGPGRVRVRIMVKPENTVTLGLYRSMGFVDAGKCTLEEALRANGDADMLPAGMLPDKYTARSGVIMAMALERRPN